MSNWHKDFDDDDDSIELDNVTAVGETKLALRVRLSNNTSQWIPQSVITSDSEVYELGHKGRLVVKRWFAEKEGLV